MWFCCMSSDSWAIEIWDIAEIYFILLEILSVWILYLHFSLACLPELLHVDDILIDGLWWFS